MSLFFFYWLFLIIKKKAERFVSPSVGLFISVNLSEPIKIKKNKLA